MDLAFLYSNLFDEDTTSPEDFNTLVENGMKLLQEMVTANFD